MSSDDSIEDGTFPVISSHPDLLFDFEIDTEPAVAGGELGGWLIMDCQAEPGTLAIGDLVLYVVGRQILRLPGEHNRFEHLEHFHCERVFQAPSLEPCNAVDPDMAMELDIPANFYPARQGETRFPFCINLPPWLPASIDFESGVARVLYELRASATLYDFSDGSQLVQTWPVQIVEAPMQFEIIGPVKAKDGGLNLKATIYDELVVDREIGVVVEVHNTSRRTISSMGITFYHHLTVSSNGSPPFETVRELHTERFDDRHYRIHPEESAKMTLPVKVPNFTWGCSGYRQQGVDGLFKVQTLMAVSVSTHGMPDSRLILPVEVIHPVAALSRRTQVPYRPKEISPSKEPVKPLRISDNRAKRGHRAYSPLPPPKPTSTRTPPVPIRSPGGSARGPSPLVSPTPVRGRSGSFGRPGPFSEDVRHLEEVVQGGYDVPRASPFRAPLDSSEEESLLLEQKAKRDAARTQRWANMKAPPLPARLVVRHPRALNENDRDGPTPMPLFQRAPGTGRPAASRTLSVRNPSHEPTTMKESDDDGDIVVYQPPHAIKAAQFIAALSP